MVGPENEGKYGGKFKGSRNEAKETSTQTRERGFPVNRGDKTAILFLNQNV